MRPDTMPGLISWLMLEADNDDAFGPTDRGFNLRLAASIIAEMEGSMQRKLSELSAEVRRLEMEMARVS